jgi:D-alanyl-lipoteichoic acid acyltransferase DltB (MBOAT superfamily)
MQSVTYQSHYNATQLFSPTAITGSVVLLYYITAMIDGNTESQANDLEHRNAHLAIPASVSIYALTHAATIICVNTRRIMITENRPAPSCLDS